MKTAKRYIYPPRPVKDAVPIENIGMFKKYGWKAQLKFNDKRLCLSLSPECVEFYNRHNDKHRNYTPPEWLVAEIRALQDRLGLDRSKWSYLDGGLLHGKSKWVSDVVAIWDILVRDDDWLVGSTYGERYQWLLDKIGSTEPFILMVNGKPVDLGIKISDHLFIPRVFDDYMEAWGYARMVNEIAGWSGQGEPLLEGIVVKSPAGVLERGRKEENNTSWQARSRIYTKRAAF